MDLPTKKRKLAEFIATHRLRLSRGDALLSFFREFLKSFVYLGGGQILIQKWTGYEIPNWFLFSLAPLYPIIMYILGSLDEKYGFWRFENARTTIQLNPVFEKMELQIDHIAEKLRLLSDSQNDLPGKSINKESS